jgi:hypothetical protein
MVELEYSSAIFLIPRHQTKVSGQLDVMAPLPPSRGEENPGTSWKGLVGPRASMDAPEEKNLCPSRQ